MLARRIAAASLFALGLAACSAQPGAPAPEEIGQTEAPVLKPVTRSKAIANAEEWVAAKLQYCQSPNGKPDPDALCASTCTRESNPDWDPYRSDCSGLISWAWELPAPGLVTSSFAPFGASASKTIDCDAMLPGDAANRNNVGHIVLFKEWVTPGSKAVFIEEPGCSGAEPYAREFTSDVTCNGVDVTIATHSATYTAIRFLAIEDDPDAGPAAGADAGAGTIADAAAAADAAAVPVADDATATAPTMDASMAATSSGCDASGARSSSRSAWLVAIAIGALLARRRRSLTG